MYSENFMKYLLQYQTELELDVEKEIEQPSDKLKFTFFYAKMAEQNYAIVPVDVQQQ